jgi:hypothetical protein
MGPQYSLCFHQAFLFLSSTWSPCGQFIAVVSEEAAEIRDALALNLLSTLESPGVATKFRHGLAYSQMDTH